MEVKDGSRLTKLLIKIKQPTDYFLRIVTGAIPSTYVADEKFVPNFWRKK
jgi:hypothetical protein